MQPLERPGAVAEHLWPNGHQLLAAFLCRFGVVGEAFGATRCMSKFVNYKKRGITLPPGCKDLIELLEPQRRAKAQSFMLFPSEGAVTRDDSGTLKVAEIEKYVAMIFESHAQGAFLTLNLADERLTVTFASREGKLMSVWAAVDENADRKRLIQDFWVEHGFELPGDDVTPTQFVPGVPVQHLYHIRPLPSDAPTASKIAADLFRHVCGVGVEEPLSFNLWEF